MRHTHGRVSDITSLPDLDRRLAARPRSLAGWRVIGLDLTSRGPALLSCSVAEALFLGCHLTAEDDAALRARGAVVFPVIPDSPADPYQPALYAPEDLYDTPSYADSLDARCYAWSQHGLAEDGLMAIALHDHAIDQALGRWVRGRRVVGVMGGHALRRGTPGYAAAARLGHRLGSRMTVATGGGPGAMEAANLGAFLSASSGTALDDALARLARVPTFVPDVDAWARVALEVVADVEQPVESLGIPTWHYGHEPPNPCATAIAKYFSNATREAILLEVCRAGIVFLPGAGGTVQEIFQDACENYYADPASVAPMVLVGRRHWTEELPAWPLLQALARDRAMEGHVHLVDSVEDAVDLLSRPDA